MAILLDAIRDAIKRAEADGVTRYQIAKDSGVSQAVLSRFVNRKRGLGVELAEQLAKALGVCIVIRVKRTRRVKNSRKDR
ncbi:MAG: helix-turn-helix domain-containing protein [Planctomycetota bacterium]